MISLDNYIIRRELPSDYAEAENLTREAFWNVYRPGCLEHYVLHCFRDKPEFVPELDLVMEQDGRLIGHIMYVRAEIELTEGGVLPIMTFGPISITPELKRKGYGKRLLDYSMNLAADMGAGALCMEGNINFYGKSGFVLAGTKGIRYHAEPDKLIVPYFLLKELTPNYLDGRTGVYHTPKGYYVDERAAEEFDRHFPNKVKLRLPGQLV